MSETSQAAADALVQSWVSSTRLDVSSYPSAPTSAQGMYETHLLIQQHPLVATKLGGLGGYKLGGVGLLPGEPCLYAPLFAKYIVDSPGELLSASSIGMIAIEPEIGVVMGEALPPRPDGRPHSVEEVWSSASSVVLVFEVCGKRGTDEAHVSSTRLGQLADTLSSGGCVRGQAFPASSLSLDALRCGTKLFVNDLLVAEGSGGAAPLGGPAEALAFLANHLNSRGLELLPGQLIATGQTCNTKVGKPGDVVRATFEGLGTVEMRIFP